MTVREASLAELRAAGRGHVRRRLEALVNADIIGLAGAQKVYRDAFGGELMAVKAAKPSSLFGWFRTLGSQSRGGDKEEA